MAARSNRGWEYHWWDPLWGACFGLVAGVIARGAGWSLAVSIGVAVVVGALGASVTALAVWVDRREADQRPAGWPERLFGWCADFLQTYARANRRVWYAIMVLMFVSLVWIGLTAR
jgi:hypothetical protein